MTREEATAIIERFREGSFDPGVDIYDFMRRVARRAQMLNGSVVCSTCVEGFVRDVRRLGLLTEK